VLEIGVVYGSCNANNEPADVLVREDGVPFVSLGRFDHGVSMGFDLARVALTIASCVRLQDLPVGTAFDLDAACALQMLTVEDEWTRECLAIDVARGLRSEQVLDRLAELFMSRGTPACLRSTMTRSPRPVR
jgi:hypothetical protein